MLLLHCDRATCPSETTYRADAYPAGWAWRATSLSPGRVDACSEACARAVNKMLRYPEDDLTPWTWGGGVGQVGQEAFAGTAPKAG